MIKSTRLIASLLPNLLPSVLLLSMLTCASSAHADSPAETLEKGIYSEETAGDLNQAIEHYRQVLADAKNTRSLAAQAQYRLGSCLSKLGKEADAKEAFDTLIKNYPDQKELIAKVRELDPERPLLGDAPWKSGERLTLKMMLPNGQTLGIVGTSVTETTQDGKPVWEMNIRRHVGSSNSGVSQAIVDKKTNLPISTRWDHTVLGKSNAQWGSDNVVINATGADGKSSTKTVEFDTPSYCNDQWFFGFRQLPMKIGTKVTVPIRVAFTGGNAIGMEIEVSKKEQIETPAGTFECFRLDTNIQQTFWVTNTPQRYIAQFEAGGIKAVLSSIDDNQPSEIVNDQVGYSVTSPAGWFSFARSTGNETTSGAHTFVAPDSMITATLKVRKKSMLDGNEQTSLGGWADSIVQGISDGSKGAKQRGNRSQDVEIAEVTGLSFFVDFDMNNLPMTASPTLAFKDEKAIELGVLGDRDQVQASQKTIDALRDSITVK